MLALLLAVVTALMLFGCTPAPGTAPEAVKPGQAITISKSTGGNPIGGFDAEGNLVYGGDPSTLVVGDTLYLYVGHDISAADNYVIPEYLCYSTQDMVSWKYEGVVLKMSDVKWADRSSAWAGQVAARDGKYYFYFCSWDRTDGGKQSIGVAVADSPLGPFVDIGSALVKGSFTTNQTSNWNDIDPTVWVETDAQGVEHRYLCWGNGKLFMCELNEDMVSVKDYNGDGKITFGQDVKEKTAPKSFTEAPWIYRRQDVNGNYYGDYYLFYAYGWREQMAYATTSDLMDGPITYQATVMHPSATSNTNHMAVFDFLGKTWFIYHNGSLPNGSGYRRVACIQELKFNEDGSVPYIEETATGATGTISRLTTLKGDVLAHAHYRNSSSDTEYPYTAVKLGSNLKDQELPDTYWEIVPGKYDPQKGSYVSIEAYNKAGLYVSYGATLVYMSQDYDGKQAVAQTFETVMGLAGEGVSFACIGNPGFLYQQNTVRDALVAAITLNIFNKHSDRVRVACLAQMVNVLQAVILTEGERMLKTPTYHVMHMYRHHQDAQLLESCLEDTKAAGTAADPVPKLTESVSEKDGIITVTVGNLSATEAEKVQLRLQGRGYRVIEAKVVTADDIHCHNTFDEPDVVCEQDLPVEGLKFTVPAASVVCVRLSK